MNVKIKINSVDEMIHLGEVISNVVKPNMVLALNGDLGAGKTTFTKGIGKYFGVNRVINSPTFTIMKIYDTNKKNNIDKLYHLDVYRLTSSESDFELEEYFEMNGLTIIEWADIIDDLLPDDAWKVYIKNESATSRIFDLTINDEIVFNQLINLLKEENYETIY